MSFFVRALAAAASVFLLSLPLAAQSPSPPQSSPEPSQAVVTLPDLKSRLDRFSSAEGRVVGDVPIAAYEFLPKMYAALGYRLAWTNEASVAALKDAIKRSWEDGLTASDFHDQIVAAHAPSTATDTRAIETDIILSDALVRLLYQLFFGKVSPNGLDPHWNFSQPMLSDDPVKIISSAIAAGEIAALVERARVDHPAYKALKATLQSYTQYDVAGGWPIIPAGAPIKPGGRDPRILALRQRLAVTGELQDDASAASDVLDENLAAALASFQKFHGLDDDGALGPKTLAELNVTPAQRIDQVRVNLERARWTLRALGDDMVIVNIAGFYLRVVLDKKPVWATRVIVGRPYTKTPIFKGDMKHVVLNPDWTVPRSIVKGELFAKASTDPTYLAANNYVLTSSSGRVDPNTVNWSQWTASTFPYGIVQSPGPANALGLVKFLFPNKYSVYLHDTPGRGLFGKSGRSFSHGCIRVEDPMKLAEIVLGNRVGWDRAKIDATVKTGKLTQVNLPKPLPVHLLYWTVDPQPDGSARFYQDVYGRDGPLLKAINADFKPTVR
ncbi:L,D-transpeptidase family protein [uncultured Hyphomicrobium sp.]|uniref:L,D-transpeptidase family protein n=1 Tax=uncultured Hyphomicrobium sp. TaxID=194373 RepID=UPI0025F46607|nr:L,D-transpeptidase family protein [uncultured Hyphomicrobium sp.]